MDYGGWETELGSRVVLDNGYKYDRFTGVLLGQHLEPDKYNVHSAPLFVYNRTDRFYLLCQRSMPGPYSDINMCVKMFQRLEDVERISISPVNISYLRNSSVKRYVFI